MKKIIVALGAVCCLFIAGYGQDSSSRFSVGILAGPYFNTGADYIPTFYYSRGKKNFLSLSYGAEFTWYFKIPKDSKIKHGITGRFLYNINKENTKYKGPDTYISIFNSPNNFDESSSDVKRSYLTALGYRMNYQFSKKLSLIVGSDLMYISHDKIFSQNEQIQTNRYNGGLVYHSKNHYSSPKGYSTGLAINAGIEYTIFRNFSLGAQMVSSILYTHFFGQQEYSFSSSNASSQENIQYNITPINSHTYNLSPLNYVISARYYF